MSLHCIVLFVSSLYHSAGEQSLTISRPYYGDESGKHHIFYTTHLFVDFDCCRRRRHYHHLLSFYLVSCLAFRVYTILHIELPVCLSRLLQDKQSHARYNES